MKTLKKLTSSNGYVSEIQTISETVEIVNNLGNTIFDCLIVSSSFTDVIIVRGAGVYSLDVHNILEKRLLDRGYQHIDYTNIDINKEVSHLGELSIKETPINELLYVRDDSDEIVFRTLVVTLNDDTVRLCNATGTVGRKVWRSVTDYFTSKNISVVKYERYSNGHLDIKVMHIKNK